MNCGWSACSCLLLLRCTLGIATAAVSSAKSWCCTSRAESTGVRVVMLSGVTGVVCGTATGLPVLAPLSARGGGGLAETGGVVAVEAGFLLPATLSSISAKGLVSFGFSLTGIIAAVSRVWTFAATASSGLSAAVSGGLAAGVTTGAVFAASATGSDTGGADATGGDTEEEAGTGSMTW